MKLIKAFFLSLLWLLSFVDAANYYVATTGNNGGGGSIGAPWATVTHGCSTVTAGDSLTLRGGTYSEHDIYFAHSGSAVAPITVCAYPGETPVVHASNSGFGFVVGVYNFDYDSSMVRRYINFHRITVRAAHAAGIILNQCVDHVNITNCVLDSTVPDDNSAGISVRYARNVVVSNCTVTGVGTTDNFNYAGVFIYGKDGSVTVRGCDISGAAMGVLYKYPADRTYWSVISNNFIHDNLNTGIEINSDRVIIKNNLVIDNTIGGIVLGADPGTRGGSNCRVEHNTLYNNNYSVALVFTGQPSTYGPTVYGVSYDTIVNNLIIGYTGEKGSYSVWHYATAAADSAHALSDYNNYYNSSTTSVVVEFNSSYTLAQWQSRYASKDANSTVTAPTFADTSGTLQFVGDFVLTGGGGNNAASDGTDMGVNTDSVGVLQPSQAYTRDTIIVGGHATIAVAPVTLTPVDSATACTTSVTAVDEGWRVDSIVHYSEGVRTSAITYPATQITYLITGNTVDSIFTSEIPATPRMITIDTTGNGSTDQTEGVPQMLPDGDSVLVVYNAGLHNHYVSTTVTGGATERDTASGAQWIVIIGADGTATFNFGLDTFGLAYTITGGNAAVTFLGDSIAPYGESVTCTLTVDTGYTADWPGGHVGAGKHPLTVLMTHDSTLEITTQALPQYTIDTAIVCTTGAGVPVTGSGSWLISGGLTHDSGSVVTYSATASAGFSFGAYSGTFSSLNAIDSFIIQSNHVDTCIFEPCSVRVVLLPGENTILQFLSH